MKAHRPLGLPEAMGKQLKLKERQAGHAEAQAIESFVLPFAAGGDRIEDLEVLSADPGLKALRSLKRFPSPEAMRFVRHAFHDDEKIEGAGKDRPPGHDRPDPRGDAGPDSVVTTRWKEKGDEVIPWHRGKAGTVEIAHDVVENDLGGGAMPCGRFGANAAWFRLNALTHNILVAMKKSALPPEMGKLRLKALRFRLLRAAGKVIHSGRRMILKIAERLEAYALLVEARPRLVAAFALSP